MRLIVTGKGGVGKTTIAAALCRVIGRQNQPVLALDADSNPNLAFSLGLSPELNSQISAVSPTPGEWRTDEKEHANVHLTPVIPQLKEQYGLAASDNVTLLAMGNADHVGVGCRCNAHADARGILGHLWQVNGSAIVADWKPG